MTQPSKMPLAFCSVLIALSSCGNDEAGDISAAAPDTSDNTGAMADEAAFTTAEIGTFNEPWAIEFAPGTTALFITEKPGTLKMLDIESGDVATISGAPQVAYGGQGGLGDIAFLPSEAGMPLDGRIIYLTFAEMGADGETRGAALGKGTLECAGERDCSLAGFEVIWRQAPKVSGRGHFSHRIAIAPDESHLFIASGERQKQTPAQDKSNTLGSIVRLNLDGTAASGNPFASEGGVTDQIWSYGHRNILGMDFDSAGRLWEVEHGPAGGDELNLVQKSANYGWPIRSYGENYNGDPIADHSADDGFVKPKVHWTPVIAPGDMVIYSGAMFEEWRGDALIPGLKTKALIRVDLEGDSASEAARYDFDARLRSIEVGPDGAIWMAQDGEGARLLKLSR